MRLYLSSYRFGSAVERLTALVPPGARVAMVSNALDLVPEESRRSYARNVHDPLADLADMGFAPFDLDLRRWFGEAAGLERDLADVGLVWAVGGNAFLLRRAMAQSGLDAILILQVHDELIVDAAEKDADAAKEILVREMESAAKLSVPLTVSSAVGKTWYDCKD